MYLEADAPRVSCAEHGVVVAAVPWARHGSRFTTAFEDTTAWLACHAALAVLSALLRITWRSVAAIVVRVVAEAAGKRDRLAGLRRIGIDEISYRQGIHDVVAQRAPQAVCCLDAFHVVAWATAALDAVRWGVWNQLRRRGDKAAADEMKNTRWALLKNPADLTSDQKTTLAVIAKMNSPLYRAYLLKEQLRAVFQVKGAPGRALLAGWLAWAQRCRIPEFVKLARTIKRFLAPIQTNALVEALVAKVAIIGADRLIPAFRIPKPHNDNGAIPF